MERARITHTGITEKSLAAIRQNMTMPEYDLIALAEDEITEFLLKNPIQAEAMLLGEQVGNPIKIAQSIHAVDPQLSIIIVNDEVSFPKIKQALLFTPFIGNSVKCISTSVSTGLAAVAEDSMIRTQQRRSFARMQNPSISIAPNAHVYANIRTEFTDKFLDGAPIGAVLMDQQGCIMALNQFASQMLLKTEKETLGNPFTALFPASVQQELGAFIQHEFVLSPVRIFQRNLNNERQYLEIRIASIAARKSLNYKIGIISDHTRQILAQQQSEIQLEELMTTNESLKRANADLDAFVYTASHDLKAPISNIEGLVNLLEKRLDHKQPMIQEILSMIYTSVHRFQDTIKDLTDVTLILKNQDTNDTLIDVGAIIEEVQSMIIGMIDSANAQIEVENKECAHIRFSKTNFRSIIYNLLTNAIKYRSPERMPIIKIRLEKLAQEVLLTVDDNGLGFPEEKKEKIFKIFSRLHSHVEGSGIGLFIIKRIIDNTGSRIEVDSKTGIGTCFRLYLKQE